MGFARWELPIGPRCSCPLHSGSCEAAALLPSRSPRWLDPATHPNWGPHAASARSAGPFRQITPPRCQAASQLHLEGNRSFEVDMLTGHGRSTPVGTGGSVSRGRPASGGGHRSVSTGEGTKAPASCSQLELAPWACAGMHFPSQFQCSSRAPATIPPPLCHPHATVRIRGLPPPCPGLGPCGIG